VLEDQFYFLVYYFYLFIYILIANDSFLILKCESLESRVGLFAEE
jgi:hypothetical protein